MTDRYHSLTVVLEQDMRSDGAETVISAIKALRHVLTVEPQIADGMAWIAHARARRDLGQKLWAVLYPEKY